MGNSFFNEYPYTDFHELNLSWVIKELRTFATTLEQFVSINALKYADPIQWNITSQYEKNTIVIDPVTGVAYISVAPVPAGVIITNTDYWTPVFDLGALTEKAGRNIANKYEENTTLTATFPSNVNDWLIWGDVLYRVISPIIAGDQYVVGSNIEHFTLENIIGHLEGLNTTDKSSLVSAINEVLTTLANTTGDLDDLNTTDKTNIVNAINSLITDLSNMITTKKLFVGEDPDGWVEAHRGDQIDNDTIIGSSPNGKTGVAGFTRTKDNPNTYDQGTIAVTGIAQSDKDTSDDCVSWAGYFENRRYGNSSSAIGVEVDTGRYDTNKEVQNPYDQPNNQNMCVTLNLSSGCGDNDSNGADTALWIHPNPKPFKQGIVISENAVENGRPAIALPWGSMISWQAGNLDNSLMQFITGAVLYLREITTPYYPKVNFNNSDGLTTPVPEGATLGAIEFANNGTVKVEVRGTEDNGGTLTVLLPDGKYALLNKYWLSMPGMWVDCAKVQATNVVADNVESPKAFIDKSYVAGLYAHSVPLTTVKAIANDLKASLKAYWVNNKCSMTVSREDIVSIFTTHGWNATDSNILTGPNGEYVDQAELDLWISYADHDYNNGDVRYDTVNSVYQYYNNGNWTNI